METEVTCYGFHTETEVTCYGFHTESRMRENCTLPLGDRGVECYMTNGQVIRKSFGNVPERPGWVALSKIERYSKVEAIYVP